MSNTFSRIFGLNRLRKRLITLMNHEPINQRVTNGLIASHAMLARKYSFENLWDSEFRVFSQFGEDGIIDFLLEIAGISKPRILELGAGDFSECNSRFALHKRLCSAYLVDLNKDLANGLKSSGIYWKSNIRAEIERIYIDNVSKIQQRAVDFMSGIDLISIDIDGIDYWVAKELDWNEIKIAVVEYNPLFGSNLSVSVPPTEFSSRYDQHYSGLFFGASLRAWIELMESLDLFFVGTNRVGNNAFFVKNILREKFSFPIPDTRNLNRYVDWRVRDARSENGEMTYLSLRDMQKLISGQKVVNLRDMKTILLNFEQ
jgi:hypothetical protein